MDLGDFLIKEMYPQHGRDAVIAYLDTINVHGDIVRLGALLANNHEEAILDKKKYLASLARRGSLDGMTEQQIAAMTPDQVRAIFEPVSDHIKLIYGPTEMRADYLAKHLTDEQWAVYAKQYGLKNRNELKDKSRVTKSIMNDIYPQVWEKWRFESNRQPRSIQKAQEAVKESLENAAETPAEGEEKVEKPKEHGGMVRLPGALLFAQILDLPPFPQQAQPQAQPQPLPMSAALSNLRKIRASKFAAKLVKAEKLLGRYDYDASHLSALAKKMLDESNGGS
jgi:hypothetical protein